MEISPYMLTLLLVYSFLFGAFAGALNDAGKIFRALLFGTGSAERQRKLCDIKLILVGKLPQKRESKALPIIVFICDVLLFLCVGCGIAILNYYFNKGQMRLYTITAVAVGFLFYYFTIGKIISFLSDYLVFFLRAVTAIALKLFLTPFAIAFGTLKKIFLLLVRKIVFALEKKSMIRYNEREVRHLGKLSERGFTQENAKED